MKKNHWFESLEDDAVPRYINQPQYGQDEWDEEDFEEEESMTPGERAFTRGEEDAANRLLEEDW